MKKLFFLPCQGEFGFYITIFIRWVYITKADEKVVCIRPGHECLFPTATDFFYEVPEFLPDKKKWGNSNRPWVREQLEKIKKEILIKYPEYNDYEFIMPFEKWHCYNDIEKVRTRFEPKYKKQGLKADVVITPRKRNFKLERNYEGWHEIVGYIKRSQLTVASIGDKHTSFTDLDVDIKSWDYGYIDPIIELIKNSKVVLATNTGLAHLVVFLAHPMLLIRNSEGMICWMECQRGPNTFFKLVYPIDPQSVIRQLENYLNEYLQ